MLPIEPLLPTLVDTLAAHSAVVLQAPPGAGKTTRVPLALLAADWLAPKMQIILLEPRRLAAQAAAHYLAAQLGESVGKTVGYRTRLEVKVSAATRIEVVTEGILTRRLQQDAELNGVGVVIFDEFHERSLNADVGLAFCLETQQALRPDLKIVVMSATLDGQAVAALLDNAPILTSEGRSYPVDIEYFPLDGLQALPDAVAQHLLRILPQTCGDILVFLAGSGEIRQVQRLLTPVLPDVVTVYPLYGDLGREMQERALRPAPAGERKIVLATPLAETSLTIEGITTVVDSGWCRRPRFDPRSGLTRLTLQRISKSSATQRAGRAGRVQAGVCHRLWSKNQQDSLSAQTPAEILEADLTPLALDLAQWGVQDVQQLRWLDAPPVGALAQARSLLQLLGALDVNGRLTALGQAMSRWALHPRLARLLCAAEELGWGGAGCEIAALLSERDIVRDGREVMLAWRLDLLQVYRERGREAVRQQGGDADACHLVEQLAQQWKSKLIQKVKHSLNADSIGILLALAYPDRIAVRRVNSGHRYVLANGRGASLPPDQRGEAFIVAAHLDKGEDEARIYLAAPISREALLQYASGYITQQARIAWDDAQGCVVAQTEQRLGQLILSTAPLLQPDSQAVQAALLQGIRQRGLTAALNWTEAVAAWHTRVLCLRAWMPDLNLPHLEVSHLTAELETWLSPFLSGKTRLNQVYELDISSILQGLLTYAQLQHIETHAPSHLTVPSGSRIRLQYTLGEAPILAVRLQEMFGLQTSPTVADGRIKVMLHLLSPAYRPIQITQDLANFWARTYHEVKKELKGRYPKHYWPDDPYVAQPTARRKAKM